VPGFSSVAPQQFVIQTPMRSLGMVMRDKLVAEVIHVPLAEHHEIIQAFLLDTLDEPFDKGNRVGCAMAGGRTAKGTNPDTQVMNDVLEFLDLTLEPLPPLTSAAAAEEATRLTADMTGDRLLKLATLRVYQRQGLLTADQGGRVCQQNLGSRRRARFCQRPTARAIRRHRRPGAQALRCKCASEKGPSHFASPTW
jgi:hypothetical protein